MNDDTRLTTRRKLLAATGSAALVGLAGCLGDDDGGEGGETESTVTLLVEGIEGSGHDDNHDDGHNDDEAYSIASDESPQLLDSHDDDHDISEGGLSDHDIDHACGHMEFDDPEPLDGGSSVDDAPTIDATHQPFAVTFTGDACYVKFVEGHDNHDDEHDDHGNSMFGFFTEGEPITAVEGHSVYEGTASTDVCDDIGRYAIAEPDHGEIVVELSPDA